MDEPDTAGVARPHLRTDQGQASMTATADDDDDYCSRCTCWIWEALGWLPPNSRCADVAARRKTAEQAGALDTCAQTARPT